MVPNLKKGKTEVLIVPKGPGSKKVKSDLFGTGDPHLVIPDVPEDFQRVRLISQYRHLGAKVHVGTKLMVEIKARMGQAWTTYRKMRRQIFQNRLLGLSRRISLFPQSDYADLRVQPWNMGALAAGRIPILFQEAAQFL